MKLNSHIYYKKRTIIIKKAIKKTTRFYCVKLLVVFDNMFTNHLKKLPFNALSQSHQILPNMVHQTQRLREQALREINAVVVHLKTKIPIVSDFL